MAKRRVFTYGSLQDGRVIGALLSDVPRSEPARLLDFACLCVRGAVYPGIVERRGAATAGRLYAGIDAAALDLLDRFEGPLFERRSLRVVRADGSTCTAEAWVVVPHRRSELTAEPWDLDGFVERDAAAFADTCRDFRAHYLVDARRATPRPRRT